MTRLPLLEKIEEYIERSLIYFCMPGHKMGRGFTRDSYGRRILDKVVNGDLTEVDGLDNLYAAEEVLEEEMKLLARTYGSERSLFLVNGSTSGNHIMMFSSLKEKNKIIVERNCHKSIMDGVIMRKLHPVYIDTYDYEKYDAPLVFEEEHIIDAMKSNPDSRAIILTYPNYYGGCFDIERIVKEAKKLDIRVLIDSAHGAHFGINDSLPISAVKAGADMVVVSAHKTLPSFTQTAFLHINNKDLIHQCEKYWKRFSSTSPSYMFMASMAYSRYYLDTYGKEDYEEAISLCDEFKEKIESLNKFQILSREQGIFDVDRTRYTIIMPHGYSGDKLGEYILSKGIQYEMSNYRCVVLILSYFNTREEFLRLYEVLRDAPMECMRDDMSNRHVITRREGKLALMPYEVDDKEYEIINYQDSEGRICATSVVPYPPGVPIINIGEIIDKEAISYIKQYIESGNKILGIEKEKIEVILK